MSRPAHSHSSSSSSRPYLGLAQVSCTGILWGTGGLAVVVVQRYAELSAVTISAYRAGIAAIVVVTALLGLGQMSKVQKVLTHHLARVVAVGLLTGAYQGLYFISVVAVGVTVSTVISLGLAPVLLTGSAALRTRNLPTTRALIVVLAALSGLILMAASSGDGVTGPQPLLGVLAGLGAGTAFAAATGFGEPLARSADPLAITAVTTSVATLGLLPVAFITTTRGGGVLTTTDPTALMVLLYLGAITMALAYGLLYAGLRTTSSSTVVIATLLEPVTAAIVAGLFLGEVLRPAGIVGGVLILLALAGSGRNRPITPGT